MSSVNKAIVRGYMEQVWNKGRVDYVGEFMADEVAAHGAPGVTGAESAKVAATRFRNAFPDAKLALDDVLGEDDKVVTRWTISGTQEGDLPDIPATGKHATWSGISIFRIANGKIVEFWLQGDNLGMMQQLGVIPAPEAA